MKSHSKFESLISSLQRTKHYFMLSVQIVREWGFREWLRRAKIKIFLIISRCIRDQAIHSGPLWHYDELRPKRVDGRKTILVVEARMLTPDRDSGSHRMWEIVKLLKNLGNHVTFAAASLEFREPYVSELKDLGIEVVTSHDVPSIESYLQHVGTDFDVIVLSRVIVASRLMDRIRRDCPNARVIFDTVDLHFLREQRYANLRPSPALLAQAEARRKEELTNAKKADVTLVVSPVEKEILERLVPGVRVEVLSNIHVPRRVGTPFSEREGLLFLGGFEHEPNVDAVHFYAKNILPLLQKRINGVKTFIVGSNPPSSLWALADEEMIITGYVKDLTPFFASCRVFIAPLRYGAGVKGKVNMSMSHGLPVVGASVALEGVYARDGVDAMVADEPVVFAEKVADVYNNADLWERLSANGLENVRRHFSPEVAGEVLERLLSL